MSWRAEEVVCRTFCFSKAWICLPSAQPHSPTEFKHNSRVKQLSSTSRIRGCSPIVYHLFVPNPYSNDQLERLCFWYHNFSSLLAKSLWFSSPLTLHISKDQLKHPFLSHRMLFGKHCSNTFWRVTFYHFISPSLQSKNYGWKTQRKMLSEDFYFLSIPVSPFQQLIWMFPAVMFLTSPAQWVTLWGKPWKSTHS